MIGADDAQTTLQAYVDILTSKEPALTDMQKKVADVDENGKIDGKDAQIILQYYVEGLAGNQISWEMLISRAAK